MYGRKYGNLFIEKNPEQHLVKCRGKILECFQFKCWQQIGKSTFHWQLSLFTLFFLQRVFEASGLRVFFEGYALWDHLLKANFVILKVFYLNFFWAQNSIIQGPSVKDVPLFFIPYMLWYPLGNFWLHTSCCYSCILHVQCTLQYKWL